MKKLVVPSLIICFMFCSSNLLNAKKKVYFVDIKLEKVIREPKLENEVVIEGGNKFKDEIIEILWIPGPIGFHFELLNNLDSSISIIWDECSFIDEHSDSHKVLHSGIKFVDKEKPMLPTNIPLLAKKKDLIYPSDYAYYGIPKKRRESRSLFASWSFFGSEKRGWYQEPIYYDKIKQKKVLKIKKKNRGFDLKSYVEQNYRFVLVLGVKEQKYSYHFFFRTHLVE